MEKIWGPIGLSMDTVKDPLQWCSAYVPTVSNSI